MTGSPSLNLRLILAASVVLVGFLGLTGLALERAFAKSSLALIEERLLAQVYGLLSAAEFGADGQMDVSADLPDPRFTMAESGLYGDVISQEGEVVWVSPNTMGKAIVFPRATGPGEAVFAQTHSRGGERMLAMAFAVEWETASDRVKGYVFRVAVPHAAYDERLSRFRRSLWGWLAAASAGLLAAQALVLGWCLTPVRRLAREVGQIERGERAELSPEWPRELRPLAVNLNHLIDLSRRQIDRYRNALGDLAHSLKTPLAVLRNLESSGRETAATQTTIEEQVGRMDRTIEYQLQRAAASGRAALGRPIALQALAARIVASLQKVHADKKLELRLDVAPNSVIRGDEGDLSEVIGNLMDNAYKWANARVRVRIRPADGSGLHQTLVIRVEDDGPGIDTTNAEDIVSRGVRMDEGTPGHGIGLAIVREIVEEAYAGQLSIGRSELGGACITATLRAPSAAPS